MHVCMNECICVCLCMYIYMCVCVCVYVCTYVWRKYACMYKYVNMLLCKVRMDGCECMLVCLYVCMSVCLYVCMYASKYMIRDGIEPYLNIVALSENITAAPKKILLWTNTESYFARVQRTKTKKVE
jgi:hypothetical protein